MVHRVSPDQSTPSDEHATLAFWLPCGSGNFLHAITDQSLFSPSTNTAGKPWPIPDNEQWPDVDVTPSSSLVARTIWAASVRNWKGSYGLHSDDASALPPKLELDAIINGSTLKMTIDATGLHRWSLTGGTKAHLESIVASFIADRSISDGHADTLRYVERVSEWYAKTSHHEDGSTASENDIYVDRECIGYFPFFQQNILLGGLFNPAFVPAEFLAPDGWEKHRAAPSVIAIVRDLTTYEINSNMPDHDVRQLALLRFLDVTFEKSLAPIKWRLERVRRALLGAALGTIHRKTSLIQLRERLPELERFDYANEAQLRGYVILVSAKLAILENVQRHVTSAMSDQLRPSPQVTQRGTEWAAMLDGIGTNVKGLESAMHHAWMARSLYEQEQTRAEQEAIAEIERIRVGEAGGGGRAAAFFTWFALVPAFMSLTYLGTRNESLSSLDPTAVKIGLGATFGILLIAGAFWAWGKYRDGNPRIFYESNLRLDLHADPIEVGRLLDGHRFKSATEGRLRLRRMHRGALRVERINDEDAVFKLHIDGKLLLPWKWNLILRRQVPIHIICELFHHRPSASGEYLLRELRVICPAGTRVCGDDLRSMTIMIAKSIVDPMAMNEDLSSRVESGTESSTVIFDDQSRAMTMSA